MRYRTLCVLALGFSAPTHAQEIRTYRPFGTLREQAAVQQQWLQRRMDSVLPALMRKHGVEFWVVPMREYNEDPVFTASTKPYAPRELRRVRPGRRRSDKRNCGATSSGRC
jgi:hypothetical protein